MRPEGATAGGFDSIDPQPAAGQHPVATHPRADDDRVVGLEIEAQAPGTRRRIWVELIEDALGQPVCAPVEIIRGRRPGPVLGLTAALHGDELNGIAALHRLLAAVDPEALCGSIAAVLVVNVPGYLAGRRRFVDGNDLNHVMPGKAEGKDADRYAYQLVERIASRFDALIDLHTASRGRINSLYVRADMSHPESAAMARRQGARIILNTVATPTTLRGVVAGQGGPAITLEIGDPGVWQASMIEAAVAGIWANLLGLGMLDEDARGPARAPGPMTDPAMTAAGHPSPSAPPPPIFCQRSYWLRADRGGLLRVLPALYERVVEGQPIAHLVDVFGRSLATYYAPEDGVVIGRSIHPAGRSGGRILHLGIEDPAGLDALNREGN
jgi:predicted deacylase